MKVYLGEDEEGGAGAVPVEVHSIRLVEALVGEHLVPALWNRNNILRFRFRFQLLKSYVWFRFRLILLKSYGSVPVPAPYLDHKKQIFQKKCWKFFLPFYPSKEKAKGL